VFRTFPARASFGCAWLWSGRIGLLGKAWRQGPRIKDRDGVEVERGVCPALTLTARLPGADSLPSIRVRPLGAVPAGEMLLQLQTSGGQQPGSCFRLSPRADSLLDVDLMVAYLRAASTNL